MIFAFKIQQKAPNDFLSNVEPLWESIQRKLATAIPTSDDDNEWFDEYSMYIYHSNDNGNLSPQKQQEAQTQTETDLDSRKPELIKNANDFSRYFEHCTMNGENKNIPTRVPMMIKVEPFFFFLCKDIQNKINKNTIHNNKKQQKHSTVAYRKYAGMMNTNISTIR